MYLFAQPQYQFLSVKWWIISTTAKCEALSAYQLLKTTSSCLSRLLDAASCCILEPTQGGAVTYWDGGQPQSMSTERHAADHTPKLSKNKPRIGQQWGPRIEASVNRMHRMKKWKNVTRIEWEKQVKKKQKLINQTWMRSKWMNNKNKKHL